jgi:hypothetical protein
MNGNGKFIRQLCYFSSSNPGYWKSESGNVVNYGGTLLIICHLKTDYCIGTSCPTRDFTHSDVFSISSPLCGSIALHSNDLDLSESIHDSSLLHSDNLSPSESNPDSSVLIPTSEINQSSFHPASSSAFSTSFKITIFSVLIPSSEINQSSFHLPFSSAFSTSFTIPDSTALHSDDLNLSESIPDSSAIHSNDLSPSESNPDSNILIPSSEIDQSLFHPPSSSIFFISFKITDSNILIPSS